MEESPHKRITDCIYCTQDNFCISPRQLGDDCEGECPVYEKEQIPLFFKDGGDCLASDYIRVVHGKRGDYVELSKDQLAIELVSKFRPKVPEEIADEPFYYYWLMPKGRQEKIYWQIKTVKYADYRRGFYYISVDDLKDFKEKYIPDTNTKSLF